MEISIFASELFTWCYTYYKIKAGKSKAPLTVPQLFDCEKKKPITVLSATSQTRYTNFYCNNYSVTITKLNIFACYCATIVIGAS